MPQHLQFTGNRSEEFGLQVRLPQILYLHPRQELRPWSRN